MVRYGIIFLVICLCLSLTLGISYKITQAKVKDQLTLDENELIFKEIFPGADAFQEQSLDGQVYYLAKKDGQALGFVQKIETQGCASVITMLVGFDKQGIIKGIEILSQQETPGRGAKIVETMPGEKRPWFLKQFLGKFAAELDLKNIQAITSATITSEAVLDCVKKSVEEFLAKVHSLKD